MTSTSRSCASWDIPLLISETEPGNPPEQSPEGSNALQPVGKGAPQESPQRQILPVFPVHGIPVRNKDPQAVQIEFRVPRIDLDPELPGKIVGEEEVVVAFAEADPDPGLPQLNEPFHHRPEFGINAASPFEPEIKEISRNDEKIGHDGLLITRPAGFTPLPRRRVEKLHALFISGIGTALEVYVGKKDRLHDGFPP